MEVELETLKELKAWELVRRTPGMKVLPSTWAFRPKRRPDGEAKKFKAHFCARGDLRIAIILAAKLNLVLAQCNITAAFLHAHLPPDEVVYIKQPQGFEEDPKFILRCNRCLYGL
ncbi:hypothetical protein ACHAWF_007903, partial [Thalassiosira exigua]